MACTADEIIAAPFAIIGSIGVVVQLPNFHRFLDKKNIDFELVTAGRYKRSLTMFGKNTNEGRAKLQEEVEDIHHLFQNYITRHRPKVNIEQVATGEHWYGTQALNLNLIDQIMTSDDYLLKASDMADIYQINLITKKTLSDKISSTIRASLHKVLESWYDQNQTIEWMK